MMPHSQGSRCHCSTPCQPSRLRWHAVYALLVVSCGFPVQAQEYIRNTTTAPATAEELDGPIAIAFPEPPPAGMTLDANLRTYNFLRDNGDTVPRALKKNEAWAGGASINLETGLLWDTVSVGAEYFGSFPIDAPDSRPGTGLLKPIQDSISVFGQAYVRGAFGEQGRQVVTLGRQRYHLPYLNGNDGRMVPNTFLGYSIDGRWSHGRFVAGYVDKIKLRASDDFIPMSQAAGVPNSDEGLFLFGMRYERNNKFWGAIASVVPDVLSTIYSELDTRWSSGDWGFRLGAQFTDQRSIGDHLLTGTSFNTQSLGGRFSASINNMILSTVLTHNGDGSRLRTPFGGDPSFNTLMLSNFELANQTTYQFSVSYTGTRFGLPAVSGFLNYARGVNAEDARTGMSLPDDEEIDLTLDFRRNNSSPAGMWLRLRYAVLNPGSSRERYNIRLTFNWGLPLL